MSGSVSVSSRFRRAFSTSSAFSRVAASGFIPLCWLRERWKVCSTTPSGGSTFAPERLAESVAAASWASSMTCSGSYRFRLVESLQGRAGAGRETQGGCSGFLGVGQDGRGCTVRPKALRVVYMYDIPGIHANGRPRRRCVARHLSICRR